jgi:hypothetical protein
MFGIGFDVKPSVSPTFITDWTTYSVPGVADPGGAGGIRREED